MARQWASRLVATRWARHLQAPCALEASVRVSAAAGCDAEASALVAAEVRSLMREGLVRTGIQVAAYLHGQPLLSVWGGACGVRGAGVREDSLFMAYSVAKGVAATSLIMTCSKAGVAFDDPVATVWPSFAPPGSRKQAATIAQAAGYRAGMPDHPPLSLQAAAYYTGGWRKHWADGIRFIEEYEPEWEPGTRASYHPISFSWIVGGICQAADPCGRHISDIVASDIAGPLGLEQELFLGRIPLEALTRVVQQVPMLPAGLPATETWHAARDSAAMCALANTHAWSQVCLPSSNGYFSARALAQMYGAWAHHGEVQGPSWEAGKAGKAGAVTPAATAATAKNDSGSSASTVQLIDAAVAKAVAERVACDDRGAPATLSRFATKGDMYRDTLGFHPYAHEEPELYGGRAASTIGCSGAGGTRARALPPPYPPCPPHTHTHAHTHTHTHWLCPLDAWLGARTFVVFLADILPPLSTT